MDVLVTGFQGYGDHGTNPTEEIVSSLQECGAHGVRYVGAVLPVSYENLEERILQLLLERTPDAAILLGLWPGEPFIRVERFALNRNAFEIPDNEGRRLEGPILPSGPVAYSSGLPVEAAVDRLLAAGIPARASSSAGNFLCNALFYMASHAAASNGLATRVGFVHVPYLPQQVAGIIQRERRLELHQRADLASMELATQIEAIRLIGQTVAGDA